MSDGALLATIVVLWAFACLTGLARLDVGPLARVFPVEVRK